jgi:hypothetical protein
LIGLLKKKIPQSLVWFGKAAEGFEENRSDGKEKCFSISNRPELNQ